MIYILFLGKFLAMAMHLYSLRLIIVLLLVYSNVNVIVAVEFESNSESLKNSYQEIIRLAPEYPDSAYVLAKNFLKKVKPDDYQVMGSGYFALAESYYYLQEFDSARMAYQKSYDAYAVVKDKERMAVAINNIGLVHYYKSDYRRALNAYETALDLEHQLGNDLGMAQCYQNIGIIYSNWQLYESSMKNNMLALELYQKVGEIHHVAELTNNIGIDQVKLNRYDEALKYYKESYSAFSKLDDKSGLGSVTNNLGQLFIYLKQYDRSLEYFYEAIKIFESLNDKRQLIYAYSCIGDVFYEIGKSEKALEYYFKAEELNKEIGIQNIRKDNLFDIYEAYTRLKDYKRASQALVEYYELKDSIYSQDNFNKLVELEKKYHIEKSQRELMALKAKDDQRQLMLWSLIIVFSLALIIAYVIFHIKRMKERQRRLVLEQKILRTQMNPHFIFNSLSALQCLIMDDKQGDAVDFVAEFSGLMRLILQYSKEEMISLRKEEEILEYYMSLQNRRFSNKINYRIEIDPTLSADKVLVPPMLAQPFMENAIEHGELNGKADGMIKVSFIRKDSDLEFLIEDNGVGVISARSKSRRKKHKSMALDITRDRLRLLYHNVSDQQFDLEIEDLSETGKSGTRVRFHIPYQELN